MYKDKDKQLKSNRLSAKRYRLRKKGMTVSQDTPTSVIPDSDTRVIPLAPGQYKTGSTVESIMPDDYEEPKKQSHNPMMVGYVPPR